ncbi:MAG: hypothetical protein GC145_12330 [Caulobacter sp.]|nr:hypothetical protein [Caulobacter sp.]
MRGAVLIGLAGLTLTGLSLTACATEPEANPGSYTLGRGLVNYDEMNRAKKQCEAAGGVVRPFDDGGDPNQMSNYQCVISKKEKAQ